MHASRKRPNLITHFYDDQFRTGPPQPTDYGCIRAACSIHFIRTFSAINPGNYSFTLWPDGSGIREADLVSWVLSGQITQAVLLAWRELHEAGEIKIWVRGPQ